MTDGELVELGKAIRDRIYPPGFEGSRPKIKMADVAAEADVSTQTIRNTFKGEASREKADAIWAALDRIEADIAEHPEDYEEPATLNPGIHEVEMDGVFGISRVVYRSSAPVTADEIKEIVSGIRDAIGLPDS